MSAEINYKSKYLELRSKYMSDLDMAFRLGFEQGGQQAQQDQMAQQQAEAQQMQQAAAAGAAQPGQSGEPGQPGQEGGAPGQEAGGQPGQPGAEPGQNAGAGQPGSELDQHIAKLESMIAKSEEVSSTDLKKYIGALKQEVEMKKSTQAISAIAKALHKPAFKMSKQASINLNSIAKSAVSLQEKIVTDVMAKMEAEERRAQADIKTILKDLTKE